MRLDLDQLKQWIGKTETQTDHATLGPLRALMATLDHAETDPKPDDFFPACGHWLYFLPAHRQSELDADGHARRGRFLPPVPLPRRMWAGSRLEFVRPLSLGQAITKTSRIVDVSGKEGRTGPLVFVHVHHEISVAAGPALLEDQDIVYRDIPKVGVPASRSQAAPVSHDWARDIHPDPVLLFRYSALTFNGHRIHYDRKYANEVERYPGLVVHGPLIATLLLDLLNRHMPEAQVLRFSFRALQPAFDTSTLGLRGKLGEDRISVHLWAQHTDGTLCMEATATLAER